MYDRSARLYDELYADRDYAAQAARVHQIALAHDVGEGRLLDVACGTGRHLAALGRWYAVEGLDLSPALLAAARARCPSAVLHEADMRDFALPGTFDVVTCLFSAIGYAQTLGDLGAAIGAMARHVRPGGLLLVEPWFTPEEFWDGHVAVNRRSAPGLELVWMYRQVRRGRLSVLDIHHLLDEGDGVEHFVERHELGLHSRAEMEQALAAAGVAAAYERAAPFGRGLYVARRPPA